MPRRYLKLNDAEPMGTSVANRQELPLSPLMLHFCTSAASMTRSVPIADPYMWYLKLMLSMSKGHPEPS